MTKEETKRSKGPLLIPMSFSYHHHSRVPSLVEGSSILDRTRRGKEDREERGGGEGDRRRGEGSSGGEGRVLSGECRGESGERRRREKRGEERGRRGERDRGREKM